MITLLVGHRGVGKTTFLESLKAPGIETYDLDREIERRTGRKVSELISRESEFRALEHKILSQITAEAGGARTFVAVGAGYEGPPPAGVHVLWLRRATDAAGRAFLNRPRLNPRVSPLDEYRERFTAREARYREWADEELLLPEGYDGGLEVRVRAGGWQVSGTLTVLPENFRHWSRFYPARTVALWELRDDLLDQEQLELALGTLPREKILYARRTQAGRAPEGVRVDWALELGPPPANVHIVSRHERGEDLASTLHELERVKAPLLKLAVEVHDFTELEQGHRWWRQDPARRAFLPRSTDGRWRWYRSLFGPSMPLHFIREGMGSAADQPPLWQALLQPPLTETGFAAVLGDPVEHSRTPLEQRSFFAARGMPVVAIRIPEAEFASALSWLTGLGLRYAAVTSPLKKQAWAHADRHTREARQLQAANTLTRVGAQWEAHNTDVLALARLREPGEASVWLWGGGGVKSSVKAIWPEAVEISARAGIAPEGSPDLLLWAVGRARAFRWPPATVRPGRILDLNYGEDSPGLEWAVRENLPYQSGLRMFKLQAEFQREHWRHT